MRALARARQQRGFSQSQVAARMRTSQPAIAKIETGEIDVRASTIDRYAAAIGGRVEYRFVPARTRARSLRYAGTQVHELTLAWREDAARDNPATTASCGPEGIRTRTLLLDKGAGQGKRTGRSDRLTQIPS